jgi:hypothetical protein
VKTSALLVAVDHCNAQCARPAQQEHRPPRQQSSIHQPERWGIGNVFISLGLAKGEQLGEMAINGSGQGKDQSK